MLTKYLCGLQILGHLEAERTSTYLKTNRVNDVGEKFDLKYELAATFVNSRLA